MTEIIDRRDQTYKSDLTKLVSQFNAYTADLLEKNKACLLDLDQTYQSKFADQNDLHRSLLNQEVENHNSQVEVLKLDSIKKLQ